MAEQKGDNIPSWLKFGVDYFTGGAGNKIGSRTDANARYQCEQIDGGTWNAETRACEGQQKAGN